MMPVVLFQCLAPSQTLQLKLFQQVLVMLLVSLVIITVLKSIFATLGMSTSQGGGGGGVTYTTIAAIRALFTGSATNAPANTGIHGIVISDKDAQNITGRNMVIQETGGSWYCCSF